MVTTRITAVRTGYRPPNTATLRQQVAAELSRAGYAIAGRQMRYPAQRAPANQRRPYVRTGTYGRSWRVRVQEAKGVVEVEGNASQRGRSYSGYVGGHRDGGAGEKQTADMASRGWANLDASTDEVLRKLEQNLEGILGRA